MFFHSGVRLHSVAGLHDACLCSGSNGFYECLKASEGRKWIRVGGWRERLGHLQHRKQGHNAPRQTTKFAWVVLVSEKKRPGCCFMFIVQSLSLSHAPRCTVGFMKKASNQLDPLGRRR